MTRMVLVNAIYFKGLWEHTFDSKMTRVSDFWVNSNHAVKTYMMYQQGHFKYCHSVPNMDSSAVTLDYKVWPKHWLMFEAGLGFEFRSGSISNFDSNSNFFKKFDSNSIFGSIGRTKGAYAIAWFLSRPSLTNRCLE